MNKIAKELLYFVVIFVFFGVLMHKEEFFARLGIILSDPSVFFHFWHLLGAVGGYILFLLIRLLLHPILKRFKKREEN